MIAILDVLSLFVDFGQVVSVTFQVVTGYDSLEDWETTRYHTRRLAEEAEAVKIVDSENE